MRATLIGFIFYCCCAVSAFGQDAQLGQSRAEVLKLLGDPSSIYSPKDTRHYKPSDRDLALSVSGYVSDIYPRFYGGLEFSLSVAYRFDRSLSRLHPTERVIRMDLTPDKDLPFLQLASTLPYTKQLCAEGCKLLGTESGTSYEVFIYPKVMSAEQSALSVEIANGFAKPTKSDVWVPCILASFLEKAETTSMGLPKFNALTVDRFTVDVFNPDTERRLNPLVKEMDWVP